MFDSPFLLTSLFLVGYSLFRFLGFRGVFTRPMYKHEAQASGSVAHLKFTRSRFVLVFTQPFSNPQQLC